MDDASLIKAVLITVCAIICFWCTETLPNSRRKGCPIYDLKNGIVVYRGGNRIVKHECDRGYILVGSRHSTCVRGKWNKPLPVCASTTGCDPLRPPSQGFLLPSYNRAITYYKCNPGYALIGSSPVYCDGSEWNGTSPACIPAIHDPMLSCNFEQQSLCDWSQDTNDDFDWRRNQFSTPSGQGTGPSHDHTHGLGLAGHYMYIEASAPRRVNDTARLYSPVYQPDLAYSCFIFWYHMFGATIGSLRVYIKKDDESLDKIQPFWQKDGEQGTDWLKGTIPIPTLHRNFQVIIEGVRGTNYFGDIAIDDVNLQFESCKGEDGINSCSGRCGQDNSTAGTACGCDFEKCEQAQNCCEDFHEICVVKTSVGTDSSSVTPIISSHRTSDVKTKSTGRELSISAVVTKSSTLSTATQPITYETTNSIELLTSTHVSVTDTPISSQSVADVITPSQLRSIDSQTSSIASTTAELLEDNTSTRRSTPNYRWRTKKQPKSALAQVSEAPSEGVLAGIIIVVILMLLASVGVFIYFKRYRFRNDKLSDDSDMRYLSGSEELEYVDNYHSSSCVDELIVT